MTAWWLDRRWRVRGAAIAVSVAVAGLAWGVAWPRFLAHRHAVLVQSAAQRGWQIAAVPDDTAWPGFTLPLGPAMLRTAALRWVPARMHYVPGVQGHWRLDGPHRLQWGDGFAAELHGTIRLDIGATVTVSSDTLRLSPAGPGVAFRWTPASFDGGAVTITGHGASLRAVTQNPAWAPGLSQAVAAALALLAAPDGSVTVPLRRGASVLLAAGLPVLPWAAD